MNSATPSRPARHLVLMSTFNGSRYLAQQMDSILAQRGVDVRVLVRDDGSADGTIDLLAGYEGERVTVLRGGNRGATGSFLSLVEAAPAGFDFYGFADQDDVWHADKLARAGAALAGREAAPALYCGRLRLVDEALRPIGLSPRWPYPPDFGNALLENIATGCTIVFNDAARRLLARTPVDAEGVWFHDWWAYLTVSAFGSVTFDPDPAIDYRQHADNLVGMASGPLQRWLLRLKAARHGLYLDRRFAQARRFAALYGARLGAAERRLLDGLLRCEAGWREAGPAGCRVLLDRRLRRQSRLATAITKLMLALHSLRGGGRGAGRADAAPIGRSKSLPR